MAAFNFSVFDGKSESVAFAQNWGILHKIEVFYRPQWTKGGQHENELGLFSKYKTECYEQSERKK